ncbi:alpha/beta fold hydrolase [Aliiroseovarius sp. F20344]|uniref:alpha/beta hydrolase n=1 Tax=Aliiroseovarius sp. F20344 TaxID=2926414 RepID=UPI001FF2FE62|nr:alpha/beta fold hydrolase [Aliiroseovarius sp. F20344]MCK0143272.1 alpha/beta hydrolase [Aliiroseovarius sp. F20344]
MKNVLRGAMALAAIVAAAFVIGPYEPVDLNVQFDAAAIGPDPDAYLARREAVFDDLIEGAEKQIVWAGEAGQKTRLSVVYIHGFSASHQEISPVQELVADGLGANLYNARLAGHGRSAEAMAGPTVNDWMVDFAEAMAIGRAIGDEVLIIATSTGGTIAALGMFDAQAASGVKGITFISPNFGINHSAAPLLTFPAARHWVPLATGATRGFTPLNEAQAKYWTESYPTAALMPMAAMVKVAANSGYGIVDVPAMFIYSNEDQVVSADATEKVAADWGGIVHRQVIEPAPGLDPSAHVLAGDIVSPNGTAPTVEIILDWARGL